MSIHFTVEWDGDTTNEALEEGYTTTESILIKAVEGFLYRLKNHSPTILQPNFELRVNWTAYVDELNQPLPGPNPDQMDKMDLLMGSEE